MNKKNLFFIISIIFLLFNGHAYCMNIQKASSAVDSVENKISNIFNNYNIYSNFTIKSKTSLYVKENLTLYIYNTIDKKFIDFHENDKRDNCLKFSLTYKFNNYLNVCIGHYSHNDITSFCNIQANNSLEGCNISIKINRLFVNKNIIGRANILTLVNTNEDCSFTYISAVYLRILIDNKKHLTACCVFKSSKDFQKTYKKPVLSSTLDITNLNIQKKSLFKYSLGGDIKIDGFLNGKMQWKQYIKLYFIMNNITKSMISLEASLTNSYFKSINLSSVKMLKNRAEYIFSASFNKYLMNKIYTQYNISLCLNSIASMKDTRCNGVRQDLLFSFDAHEEYSFTFKIRTLTYTDLNSYLMYTVRATHNLE